MLMKFLRKRWLMLLVLLTEALIVIGCTAKAATEERCVLKPSGNLVGEEQATTLERGSYEIEIAYRAKEDKAYCRAVYDTSYGRMEGDPIPLPKESEQKKFEVRLTESTDCFFLLVQTESQKNTESTLTIEQVTVHETNQMDMERVVTLVFLFLFADTVWFLQKKGIWDALSQQQKNTVFLLLGIWMLASIPLFVNYMVTGDDFVFHAMRIEGIAEGLKAGQFPVRIQPGWLSGYGYPVSIMYGDILLYLPALLRIVGFTLQASYKCYVFVINGITVLNAYYCAAKITGERKYGILGSFLYTLSAYHILNVYFRCSVGEYTDGILPTCFCRIAYGITYRGKA